MRGCSTGVKRSPAATQVYTPAPAPVPHSKVGEMTIEERKVVALEAIDETARLWVVSVCADSYIYISSAKMLYRSSITSTRKTRPTRGAVVDE